MKNLLIILTICIIAFSCQEDNFHKTGLHNGIHDKTMLEYLQSDSYNWDSTVLVIQRAGLEELFSGNDPDHPQITFLGCTNLSILRYLLLNNYNKISDIPEDQCKELILNHVISGRLIKDDIPMGIETPKSGGKDYTTLGGAKVWMYNYTEPVGNIRGAGATILFLESYDFDKRWDIASSNIQTNTGIVHSLEYAYIFGEL